MVRTEEHDIGPDDSGGGRLYGTATDKTEQDPVAAMHDTAEEVGDEAELADMYRLDAREAEELGVALDRAGGQEAQLD